MTSSSFSDILTNIKGLSEKEFEYYYSTFIRDKVFIGGHMDFCKAPGLIRGTTDGLYVFSDNERKLFNTICEFKKDIKRDTSSYLNQLVQAVSYWEQFYWAGFYVGAILLISYNYIDIIYADDNINVLDRWNIRFIDAIRKEASPCRLGIKCSNLRKIKDQLSIVHYETDSLNNEDIFKDLYSYLTPNGINS